jgi:hypothetical protein
MSLHLLFDSSLPAGPGVTALLGINSFRDLIFRRRSLLDWLEVGAMGAGLAAPTELRSAAEWTNYLKRVEDDPHAGANHYLLCPAHVGTVSKPEELSLFLRQSLHAPALYRVPTINAPRRSGWLLLDAAGIKAYAAAVVQGSAAAFFGENGRPALEVTERIQLLDLNDEAALLDFMGGAYDSRFFNAISSDRFAVTKVSTERDKIRREYLYYGLLPEDMRTYFLPPYSFQDDGARASYMLERLFVPDMAVQWIHGAFQRHELERFLERVFRFLRTRHRRVVGLAQAERVFTQLYISKVEERVAQLKQRPEYASLAPLFERTCGSIDQLLHRYLNLIQRRKSKIVTDELVIGHGDLCFSNMLYNKSTQMLRLIDPKGAECEDELYSDAYYDIAKLSHSMLGNYDFINHGMFEVQIDDDLNLDLHLDRSPPAWAAPMFEACIVGVGYDLATTRLCEASLFISMLPLHIDRPKKVLGFVVNASKVLDRVEAMLDKR